MDTTGQDAYNRFLSGDDTAFDEILDLYHNSLIFFICGFVHNVTVAEDLAADTFAELILHPHRYNFSVTLKTYIFMIGRSRAIDYLRHNSKLNVISEAYDYTQEPDYHLLEDDIILDEQKKLLHDAVMLLKDDYRTAVHLVYFEEMSCEQAAKIMKKNKKQIENLLYRAKNALRKNLRKDGECF